MNKQLTLTTKIIKFGINKQTNTQNYTNVTVKTPERLKCHYNNSRKRAT